MNRAAVVMVLAYVFGLSAVTRAGVEFDLSVGFSQVRIDGADGTFEQQDGFRMEPRFTWDGLGNMPQLRLGFGLAVSGYSRELDQDQTIIIDDGDEIIILQADTWESLSFFQPEFQVSWRQRFGDKGNWFIEPGCGAGVLMANYWAGSAWYWSYDDDVNQWDATWEVRPFLRVGWTGEKWVFGAETSYMFGGNIDLTDEVNGNVGELYAGGFFGIRW